MQSKNLLFLLGAIFAGAPSVSAQQYNIRDIYNAGNWLNMFQFQAVRHPQSRNDHLSLIAG